MWSSGTSDVLVDYGGEIATTVICSALGALIGAIISLEGGPLAVIGGAIGAAAGIVIGLFVGELISSEVQDEDGNIWVWLGKEFMNWLVANAMTLFIQFVAAPFYIADAWEACGYLQIGKNLAYDGIGLGAIPQ